MKTYIFILLVALTVCLSFLLRVHNHEVSPPGFLTQEANLGITAMNGQWHTSQSPVYSFLTSLIFQITTPNEVSLRILNVVSGALLSVAVSLLSYRFWVSRSAAVITGLLVALGPWTIQLSRAAFPQMLSLTLGIFGLWAILSSHKFHRYLGFFFIFASAYTHPASTILVHIFALLTLFFTHKLTKSKAAVLLLTTFFSLFIYSNQVQQFYFSDTFYNEIGFTNRINELRGYLTSTPFEPISAILFNKVSWGVVQISNRLVMPWDWYWWIQRSRFEPSIFVDNWGKFYFWELSFFIFGIARLYLKTNKSKASVQFKIIFCWLLLASLPGALKLKPNFSETFFWIIPVFYLMIGYVIGIIFNKLKLVTKVIFLSPIIGAYIIGLLGFMHYYIDIFPKQQSRLWEYGYQQLDKIISQYPQDYSYQITDRLGGDPRAQITFRNPDFFQTHPDVLVSSFDKENLQLDSATITVATPDEVSNQIDICNVPETRSCSVDNQIEYPDGKVAVYIIKSNDSL